MNVQDVKDFIVKLGLFEELFKDRFPQYKGKMIVYGAVAYQRAVQHSEIYAEKKGLFVIKATGRGSVIINHKDFKPKEFWG